MKYPRKYHPMLVADDGSEVKMGAERTLALWNAYDALPEENRKRVIADEAAEKLALFGEKFQIGEKIGKVTVLVRKRFFNELDERALREELGAFLQVSFPEKGADLSQMLSFLQRELFEMKLRPPEIIPEEDFLAPADSQAPKPATLVMLPLLQGMSKYPNLGNQALSQERIRLKSQPEPVRGSLFNWLKYYRDELGIGRHSNVDRGQFLFRSENGRRLNPEERERLNLILKSLEENLPLQIDPARQEIIFPKFEFERPASPPQAQSAPASQLQNQVFQPAPRMVVPTPAPLEPAGRFIFQKGPRFGEEPKTSSSQGANPFANGGMNVAQTPNSQTLPKQVSPGGGMSFSFNHVLPAEQEAQTAPTVPRPAQNSAGSNTRASLPKTPPLAPRKMNRFRIHPMSLGPEEDDQSV